MLIPEMPFYAPLRHQLHRSSKVKIFPQGFRMTDPPPMGWLLGGVRADTGGSFLEELQLVQTVRDECGGRRVKDHPAAIFTPEGKKSHYTPEPAPRE